MSALPGDLGRLAAEHGLIVAYHDGLGVHREASAEVTMAVLRALGVPIDRPAQAAELVADLEERRAGEVLDSVAVAWDGWLRDVPVRSVGATVLDCTLVTEAGECIEWRVRGDDLPMSSAAARLLSSPRPVPTGIHRLTVLVEGRSHSATVIASPTVLDAGRERRPPRCWGVVAPTAALHSERSWGIGDLTDLEALAGWAARRGATVVGTLPLLSGFEGVASPYLPVSRRFWNELYLDPTRSPELAWSRSATARLADEGLQAELRVLRGSATIDHRRAARVKRRVVEALASSLTDAPPDREAGFRQFLLDQPDVVDYARFRAAGERYGADWRRWPDRLRSGTVLWSDVDPRRERFHQYVQWLLGQQLDHLSSTLEARGQVLYLDLPFGSHPDGYDVWRTPHQFALGLSVGAPPDGFFDQGQSWGFPPLHPQASRLDGHALLRSFVRHHLSRAALLRLDHALGLHRTFVVPDGASPTEGLYLRAPSDELYAALGVEAHRARATLVGEDLGTRVPEVHEAMDRHDVKRLHVVQFSLGDAEVPILPAPEGSLASFGTHDLPTMAGWWTATDVERRGDAGQLDEAGAETARQARADQRALVGGLAGISPDAPLEEALPAVRRALHAALADSAAEVALVSVEDLTGEVEAFNLPGTNEEHPNWNRRIADRLELLPVRPDLDAALAPMESARSAQTAAPGREPSPVTRLAPDDLAAFNEGHHDRLHHHLGAHLMAVPGIGVGAYVAVWAPDASEVAFIGDANGWDPTRDRLHPVGSSGVWEGFVIGAQEGERYKIRIRNRDTGAEMDKADPLAARAELPPGSASVLWTSHHEWSDQEWMEERPARQGHDQPMSIYEVHLGSWRRPGDDPDRLLTYEEITPLLVDHVTDLGCTHVELMPVMQHPFYGSWGYQVTGYFAADSRFGDPDGLKGLVDALHRAGIGVILDWVPSHFATDPHGLGLFDGTHCYEHADERQRVHPDWGSWLFNYGRNEVRSFLISCARHWIEEFHVDGLRMDAVASMLYLDYSRAPGEWVPNQHGGRENLEALELIRACNRAIYGAFPDVVLIAEESTSWPGVSRPVHLGGLGFGFKWDMGWMHDVLGYFRRDPAHRRYHHDELTFRSIYATSENFVLPLSHDEVSQGKGSLLSQMPGDRWQKLANLRLLYGEMFTTPGKKLLFMGGEIAQWREWHHDRSLDWHLLQEPEHAGVMAWYRHLNHLLRALPALHDLDREPEGFEWIEGGDADQSVVSHLRRARYGEPVLVAANHTPVPRPAYRVGVPGPGRWRLVANSDDLVYGGSGMAVAEAVQAEEVAWHGRSHSVELALPPLGVVVLVEEA